MKYGEIIRGQFCKRMNRFIAEVIIEDQIERVHIKNTGRLKELFLPDADVLLERSKNPERKTKFSLIAVNKQGQWVNIDSQAPNKVAFEALLEGKISELGNVSTLKREVTYGASRFDLYFEQGEQKGFIEVKGVTLERDGIAMFPDAPTTRGTKHVLELAKAVQEGYSCTILLVVQLKGCEYFVPNRETDPKFADALLFAAQAGVQILAYDTIVKEDEMILNRAIPVHLS
ncbi:DNA/RNA nuclease SfsA [Ureibacillus chungkukjangi]|uniref:Sugar fermentation stimulation protein homolog n=1 Tax=Ureibacillus chungkukjangi TaxID=1202712 RepID=A0A318TSW8_9BACL|nr:DNA/RNA nuclease SfsA [Ureibacillus chungkukjangi]MCM3387623.1 DNA/RNA nuclease SfsA [Ureibacillus chungkukjangi]PYF07941.1 sugar fermentation stimulation protein [Ureibacillus chungkukjangi]HCG4535985.1 DNA/RNA nuclease SfsA [Salmonella enterica subsp. enterica serovar Typhi str. AG3]